jgi:hypothetical protein
VRHVEHIKGERNGLLPEGGDAYDCRQPGKLNPDSVPSRELAGVVTCSAGDDVDYQVVAREHDGWAGAGCRVGDDRLCAGRDGILGIHTLSRYSITNYP